MALMLVDRFENNSIKCPIIGKFRTHSALQTYNPAKGIY